MDTNPAPDPAVRRERAAQRLAERRRHVRRIRARVAGLSLATLLAASGAVLVQLVTGHDPALARNATASAHVARDATASAHVARDATASAHAGHASPSTGHRSAARAAVRPSAVTTSAS